MHISYLFQFVKQTIQSQYQQVFGLKLQKQNKFSCFSYLFEFNQTQFQTSIVFSISLHQVYYFYSRLISYMSSKKFSQQRSFNNFDNQSLLINTFYDSQSDKVASEYSNYLKYGDYKHNYKPTSYTRFKKYENNKHSIQFIKNMKEKKLSSTNQQLVVCFDKQQKCNKDIQQNDD